MSRRIALVAALGLSLLGHGASAQIFWNTEPGYNGYVQPYQPYPTYQPPPVYPNYIAPYQSYQVAPYGYGYVPPPVFYGRSFWGGHHEGRGRDEWRGGGREQHHGRR